VANERSGRRLSVTATRYAPKQVEKFMTSLSDEEAAFALYEWRELWARPNRVGYPPGYSDNAAGHEML